MGVRAVARFCRTTAGFFAHTRQNARRNWANPDCSSSDTCSPSRNWAIPDCSMRERPLMSRNSSAVRESPIAAGFGAGVRAAVRFCLTTAGFFARTRQNAAANGQFRTAAYASQAELLLQLVLSARVATAPYNKGGLRDTSTRQAWALLVPLPIATSHFLLSSRLINDRALSYPHCKSV